MELPCRADRSPAEFHSGLGGDCARVFGARLAPCLEGISPMPTINFEMRDTRRCPDNRKTAGREG